MWRFSWRRRSKRLRNTKPEPQSILDVGAGPGAYSAATFLGWTAAE